MWKRKFIWFDSENQYEIDKISNESSRKFSFVKLFYKLLKSEELFSFLLKETKQRQKSFIFLPFLYFKLLFFYIICEDFS